MKLKVINNLYIRFVIYVLVWQLYLVFMSSHSPLGTGWLDWHAQRLFNFSEYLKLNGYFTNYGFSIMSSCDDCLLDNELWKDKIYHTIIFVSHLPVVLLNEFFGEFIFNNYGHIIDKLIVFLTGIILAETLILFSKKFNKHVYFNLRSIIFFIFFTINPWTYKMILAYWNIIYFILFFLIGNLMLLNKKNNLAFLFFFLAGCFDYQSAAGISFLYIIIVIYHSHVKKISIKEYFLFNKKINVLQYKVILSFILPVFIFFLLRLLSFNEMGYSYSYLLTRIGISGNDLHNGGILGALQFLGGNRITSCLESFSSQLNTLDLSQKIFIFNCSLSIISMFLLSIFSLVGIFYFYKKEKYFFNIIMLPLIFLLLSYTFILQQSSSVHLMGYSYFFSLLFSLGISNIIIRILKFYNFSLISIIFMLPITSGFIFLCIRVSMLTGVNG